MFLSQEEKELPQVSKVQYKLLDLSRWNSPILPMLEHENQSPSVPEEMQMCKRAFSQQTD